MRELGSINGARSFARKIAALCMLFVLAACLGCGASTQPYTTQDVLERYDADGNMRESGDRREAASSSPVEYDSPLEFSQCVEYALQNAPQVTSGSIKLQLEDLSTEDAFSEMFPELHMNLTASRVIYSEDNTSGTEAMRLTFSSGAFDPFGAYFSYEARKVLKQVAVVKHLAAVDELILDIAVSFLNMEASMQALDLLAQQSKLLERTVSYYEAIPESKASNPIELLSARGDLKSTLLAIEREKTALRKLRLELKLLVGADMDENLEFDPGRAAETMLTGFDASGVTLERAKAASRKLRIAKLSKDASKYKISVAWSEYIPFFNLGLKTPDPVSVGSTVDKDYYGTLTMVTPLVDWGRRLRGVERARLSEAKSIHSYKVTTRQFEADFLRQRYDLDLAMANDAYEKSVTELNELKHRKNKILYDSGVISLPKLIQSEIEIINSRMLLNKSILEKNLALLSLKSMSGELFDSLVSEVSDDIR